MILCCLIVSISNGCSLNSCLCWRNHYINFITETARKADFLWKTVELFSYRIWYFCQCGPVEYTEIVVSQARPGGVGWSKKDCGLYTLGRAHLCHLRSALAQFLSFLCEICMHIQFSSSHHCNSATQWFWVFVPGGTAIFSLVF